jgi:hypothetical protein
MTKIKSLAPDGSYCCGDQSISGYSQAGQELKEQFLHDARALLKQTGEFLTRLGWTECDIHVNQSGVAGSGDVYAEFWKPADTLNIIYCTIGASAIPFSGRKDGVIIMARQHQREAPHNGVRKAGKVSYRTKTMGPNHFIDPGMNSQLLATELLKIAGQEDDASAVRLMQGVSYHSRTAGVLPLPALVMRNRSDAELAQVAIGVVIAAAAADASVPNGELTGVRQMTLFEALQIQDV